MTQSQITNWLGAVGVLLTAGAMALTVVNSVDTHFKAIEAHQVQTDQEVIKLKTAVRILSSSQTPTINDLTGSVLDKSLPALQVKGATDGK